MSIAPDHDGLTTDWDALEQHPRLRVVDNNETVADAIKHAEQAREFELTAGKEGPKKAPEHVAFLRDQLGRGPLSWAMLRNGKVVRVACVGEQGYVEPRHGTDDNGPATVTVVTGRMVSTLVSDAFYCYIVRRNPETKKERRIREWFPTGDAERAIELPDLLPHVRRLVGITHTPMVRPDGTILDTPGFDNTTGYLYAPTVDVPPVPDNPTTEQLDTAVGLLRELVAEFAWAGEHDEANFMGALLTPLLRLITPPPYKLIAIMARQPGSGKSLLNRIIREVHGGVFRSEMPYDEAEVQKSISGILMTTTAPVVQFDNVSGTLRSSTFAGVLTSATFSGRILGRLDEQPMDNDRLWTITGNNLSLGGDIIRRTVWVTIDPGVPNPEQRTGFRLNIPKYLAEHRGDILHALLVLVRSWAVAGMPLAPKDSSDDYADWTRTVRGILQHTRDVLGEPVVDGEGRRVGGGIPGVFAHTESAQQKVGADDEGWGAFLDAVYDIMRDAPWSVKTLLSYLPEPGVIGGDPRGEALLEALPQELHEKYLRPTGRAGVSKSLGRWLANRDGRWAGYTVCESAGVDGHSKAKLWRVRKLEPAAAAEPEPEPEPEPEVPVVGGGGDLDESPWSEFV